MKNNLENQIKRLAYEILQNAKKKFINSKFRKCGKGEYKVLKLANNIFLTFQKWGYNWEKRYFFILWHSSKYIFETDLSRVIFNNNSSLTWILSNPNRKVNQKILDKLGYKLKKINKKYVERIYEQKKICNKQANKSYFGYYLGENILKRKAIEKYLEIIEAIINYEVNKKNKFPKIYHALEGQKKEIKFLSKERNQKIVNQRKLMDNFKCQACGYYMEIGGYYIIDCHHKKPLNKKIITKIEDLVCLCPNCHRIAHIKSPPLTVEKIKKILKKIKIKVG